MCFITFQVVLSGMIMPKMTPKKLERLKKQIKKSRLSYKAEDSYPWLKDLLDAFHIADAGVKVEIDSQIQKTGRTVACGKGCSACCLNASVKINQLELMGLSWYVTEEMENDKFKIVIKQLKDHMNRTECPFLVDESCSVYPVRPLPCRITHVFDVKCEPDEDVYKTRPDDMIFTHGQETAWLVAQKMLPHLGYPDKTDQEQIFKSGYMFGSAREMYNLNWIYFAERCENGRNQI